MQFILAVFDNFVRRTFQLKEITSLKLAVEMAKAIKIIQGDSLARGNGKRFGDNIENFPRNGEEGKKEKKVQEGSRGKTCHKNG